MKKVLTLHFFVVLLGCLWASAQEATITTAVDTTEIRIGEEVKLTFKAKVKPSSTVQFTNLPQFGPFEVIESYPIDTISGQDAMLLTKTYGITQFDSGYYRLPRLPIVVDDKIYFSDTLDIQVNAVVVDTLKQKLYDIKPIINHHSQTNWRWLWYLVIIPGIVVILYLIKLFRNKKPTSEEEVFESPIEKATTLLERLETKELWQKGEVKSYYIELTEIVRTYIEDAVEIPAMESTTSELIIALNEAFDKKEINISKETLDDLNKVLQQADLVKFAKSKPLDFEITADRKKTEEIIITFDKVIPPKEEIVILQEEIQTEKTNLITRRRIIIGSIVVISLIYIGLGSVLYVKGFDGLSALFGQKSTKEMLESEWYTSSYGYPSLKIETPEILERFSIDSLQANGQSQMFLYHTLDESLVVLVSTVNAVTNTDLNAVLEASIKGMESKGAKDIIVNADAITLGEELEGVKAFGSLTTTLLGKLEIRAKYEMMLFLNGNNLHQILVTYKENDTYAEQIKQRIFKSLEVEKVNEK